MNLFFVCIDCLRRDFIDSDYSTTPFIDSLVDDGMFFEEMHSTATTTTPCVASFMTGAYSERNGVHSLRNVELSPDLSTLAETFSRNGYNTHAYVTGPLLPETGMDRGFDVYEHRDHDEKLFTDWDETLESSLDSLEAPFFCYLHLWEIHHPIEVPEAFDSPEYGSTPYARALSAIDRRLEELVDRLPDDTVVVIHGDHGESISTRNNYVARGLKRLRDILQYERGIDLRSASRSVNRLLSGRTNEFPDHYLEDGHGDSVYDFTSNVPFVVSGPSTPSARISEQVRQIDIFPTLCEMFDLEYDADARASESLLPPADLSDRPAYIRGCGESLRGEENWIRAVRMDGYKYIKHPNRDWSNECLDLTADPMELSTVSDIDRDRFEQQLPDERLRKSGDLGIDDHLRDLGYL